ncbi:MAG TPA: hypothetical protein VF721_03900 [Pyrinomonadaceae bacterium]|jgi:hypothetical protein
MTTNNLKKFNLLFVLAIILTMSLGCSLMSKLRAGGDRRTGDCTNLPAGANCTTQPPRDWETPPIKPANAEDFFESDALSEFEPKIAEKIGGEVKALDLTIYENYLKIQVQDPQKKENVDSYDYKNGVIDEPVPVRLIGGGNLEENLFKLKEVNLAKIPELIDEAREKSKDLEGAKVSHVIVKKDLPFSNKIKIRVYLSGTRKSAWLVANASGNVLEYKTF